MRGGKFQRVAVLFARRDSVYKRLADCDVWDADRDATTFTGSEPVVAHPPCRGWGRLKRWAKPEPGELDLARWAVDVVRANGGVLEHPEGSTLWRDKDLPRPTTGQDEYGGYSIEIRQCDFGHRAQKATWLYIVGCPIDALPRPEIELGIPDRLLTQLGRAAREHTPERLARWLIEVANCAGAVGQVEPGAKEPIAAGQIARPQLAKCSDRAKCIDALGQVELAGGQFEMDL